MKNFITGISNFLKAFELIGRLKLWSYFIVPILLSFVVGGLFLYLSVHYSTTVGDHIAGIYPWERGKEAFTTISHWIGGFSLFAVSLVVYKHLIMALSSPFMGSATEKVEAHLLGKEIPTASVKQFMVLIIRSLRINFRNLGKELLYVIPLIFLSFIPVIGIVFAILIFLIQAYYAGFGNMDFTLERHYTYKESILYVKKHKGYAIGNGLVFLALLFIPILGFIIALPMGAVGGTLNVVDELKKQSNI